MYSRLKPVARSLKSEHRSGLVMVWFAFMLVMLLGMVGLVVDGGIVFSAHRHAQSAADAAALAYAMDKLLGQTDATAAATAETFVKQQQYNDLPNATVVLNVPPATGPHQGMSGHVEAIVTSPIRTVFVHLLPGVNRDRQVTARAVARYVKRPTDAGIIALDPNKVPGFLISGNGDVTIEGTVIVNSEGGGFDENGDPIPEPHLGGTAFDFSGDGNLYTDDLRIVGGVQLDDLGQIFPVDPDAPYPLHANSPPEPDPLAYLPVPTTATDPVNVSAVDYGLVDVKGDAGDPPVILSPGVYEGIKIQTDVDVIFEPGIYILKKEGLIISGDGTITGDGVMFYNTGHDFDVSSGYPDTLDGPAYEGPNNPTGSNFGQINLGGNGSWNFAPLDDPSSPFHGMFIYQRRVNTITVNISGNAGFTTLGGMIYAKWAELYISGNDVDFDASFVVGWFHLSGNGGMSVGPIGQGPPLIPTVYLVE